MRTIPLSTDEASRIVELSDEIRRGILCLDHPLQRYAKNWNRAKQGNFIRRIIQGGRFLPLQICTQFDEKGCEIRYLIDGKQRLTTLQSYVNNGFAIPKKNILDYEVTYDGVLYEIKEGASKFTLKKNRDKSLIPVLDGNGNTQRVKQTIDIRGLKFLDLPPELQESITKYMIPIQVKHNCTDEDIQLEIIDYNSGEAMNVAQLGKSRMGIKLAETITKLSQHDLIMGKCGFSFKNEIKGVIERSVGEALALTSFGVDGWKSDYKELCFDMAKFITEDDVNHLKDLFDKFDAAVTYTEELCSHMVNKEFFIVMANFNHFLDKNYPLRCYDEFIQKFVSKLKYENIIKTDDIDENGNDVYGSYVSVYATGTKKAESIENRLNVMNDWLDDYLNENCVNLTDVMPIENAAQGLMDFVENFGTTEYEALCSLMELDNRCGCRDDFSEMNIQKYKEFFENNFNQSLIDKCLLIQEKIFNVSLSDYTLIDKYNLPILIKLRSVYIDVPTMDNLFDEWLKAFADAEECAFVEIGGKTFEDYLRSEVSQTSNATILSKYAILQESFEKFTKNKNLIKNRKEVNNGNFKVS